MPPGALLLMPESGVSSKIGKKLERAPRNWVFNESPSAFIDSFFE